MPSEHRSSLIGAAIMLIILAIFANRCSAAVATAGKRCGSKVCDPLDYCSPLHEQCVPCERICSVSNNNHDAQLCASECDGECKRDLRWCNIDNVSYSDTPHQSTCTSKALKTWLAPSDDCRPSRRSPSYCWRCWPPSLCWSTVSRQCAGCADTIVCRARGWRRCAPTTAAPASPHGRAHWHRSSWPTPIRTRRVRSCSGRRLPRLTCRWVL